MPQRPLSKAENIYAALKVIEKVIIFYLTLEALVMVTDDELNKLRETALSAQRIIPFTLLAVLPPILEFYIKASQMKEASAAAAASDGGAAAAHRPTQEKPAEEIEAAAIVIQQWWRENRVEASHDDKDPKEALDAAAGLTT